MDKIRMRLKETPYLIGVVLLVCFIGLLTSYANSGPSYSCDDAIVQDLLNDIFVANQLPHEQVMGFTNFDELENDRPVEGIKCIATLQFTQWEMRDQGTFMYYVTMTQAGNIFVEIDPTPVETGNIV